MRSPEPSDIQLKFIPLDKLILHEEDDPYRVEQIVNALTQDGILRNPPIVTEYRSNYIVLDGATRISALKAMGFRDSLVQLVKYPGEAVDLQVWHHVIVGLTPSQLLADLADVEELTVQSLDTTQAHQLLETKAIEACIVMRNGAKYAVLCEGNICDQAKIICKLVAVYRGKAEVHRVTTFDLPPIIQQYPNLSAVVAFPVILPSEVIEIAVNGGKIPMGVTRHLICGRALGLNIPLDKLNDSQPLEEKNTWLNDFVQQRLRTNKLRLYQEPVFVFDE